MTSSSRRRRRLWLCLGALFGLALFLAIETAGLYRSMLPAPPAPPLGEEAEAIVVLGNRPPVEPDGRLRHETRRRLERGLELLGAGHAPLLLLVGGPYPGGGTEAEVMADHARHAGVPSEALLLETSSTNTVENARESVRLLCAERGASCHPDIILVSSPYHLERATELFRCAGAEVDPVPAALDLPAAERLGLAAREALVRFSYHFYDPCRRADPEL